MKMIYNPKYKFSKYKEYLHLVEDVDYSLKKCLPVGLLILDLCRFNKLSSFNRNLRWQLVEIHGGQDIGKYLRLHYAFRIIYFLAGLIISIFFTLSNAELDAVIVMFCLTMTIGLFFLPDYELQKRIKRRRLLLQAEFPDFLNKMTLLLGAGMTVPRSWEKIVRDSEKKTPLNKELHKSLFDIQAGNSILQAYEGFARRCRVPEINKFVTLILQNMKKGNAELVLILRVQAAECWETRKLTARKMGEESSTKMLFPLLLMLIAILLIVSAPAILAIQGV
ncbi:MAG: type II secretion system protein [Firmicutes bacterium HGW-Firmicutes-12]|jgi:tight adherence protein C|nr:MAG: type II secretion system protein [Firmicutes bacterium HGW-Firmicutes-12]